MADHRRSPRRAPRPVDEPTTFADLGVPSVLCEALQREDIVQPFPIQTMTVPDALRGRDVLGRGQTGSGKTLAFALPVLTRLSQQPSSRRRHPRALILAPTRELVRQIDDTLRPLASRLDLRTTTVFGGVPAGSQISALRRGVDIVVACPGRLEDLRGSGHLSLDAIEITVLDEADHMADLGFLPVVTRVLAATPRGGQRLLFSATLDRAVDGLVKRFLSDPVVHQADDDTSSVESMEHHVLHVTNTDRLAVLVDLTSAPGPTVVFTRTKHRARQLTRQLVTAGIPAVEMHGNLPQGARTRNLAAFRDGRATTLVATDIAARGIHVDDVRLVVHADPPIEHKSYLHRSGRTARAGAAGTVVTIATEDQRSAVRTLSRKAGITPVVTALQPGHPLLNELAPGTRSRRDGAEVAAQLGTEPPQQRARRPQPGGTSSNGSSSRGSSSRGSSSRGSSSRASASRGPASTRTSSNKSASSRTASNKSSSNRTGTSRSTGPNQRRRRRNAGTR
jgi:superfamily II DNA/RNA helicase